MATQKLLIKTLDSFTITTMYGEKEKWKVNGKWTSFKGNWNKDWKVGEHATGIFETKEDNGKTYYNITCPPEMRQPNSNLSLEILNRLDSNVKEMLMMLRIANEDNVQSTEETPQPINDDAPTPTDDQAPQDTSDEINIDDIPF